MTYVNFEINLGQSEKPDLFRSTKYLRFLVKKIRDSSRHIFLVDQSRELNFLLISLIGFIVDKIENDDEAKERFQEILDDVFHGKVTVEEFLNAK